MRELEIKASTVEQAIAQGLAELQVEESDVTIDVISKGGLFKKATVKLTVIDKPTATEAVTAPSEDNSSEQAKPRNPRQYSDKPYVAPKMEETPYDALDDNDKTCVDFVKQLLSAMGLNCYLKITSSADKLCILIAGEDTTFAIGYRGETLDNIQYLCLLVANKATRFHKKLIIDAEGYREKRAETLTILSKNIAQKVARTGRAVELEPMNPFERRVIHTALQNDKYVTTSSEGADPNRYVVISPNPDCAPPKAPERAPREYDKERDNRAIERVDNTATTTEETSAPADMYDQASKTNFKKTGAGKTRSFGNKQRRF